jgi:hypothetical protein
MKVLRFWFWLYLVMVTAGLTIAIVLGAVGQ